MHLYNKDHPPPIEELRLSKLTKPMERGRYTWEKKYATVAVYLKCGSLRETEAQTDVPAVTIENWRKTPWWPELVNEIKNASSTKLDNKLSKIIGKAMDVMEDALDNGEQVMNQKTGEMERRPVNLRDATRAASELIQRQAMLNKDILVQEIQQVTIKDTLEALKLEFSKWSQNRDNNVVEMVEEVPPEGD